MQRLEVLEKPLVPRTGLFATEPGALSRHWRYYDAFSAVFANLGLILAILDYEFTYSPDRTHDNCKEEVFTTQIFRWFNVVFTAAAVVFILLRHKTKLDWIRIRAEARQGKAADPLKRRFFSLGLVLELVLLALFPYPFLTGCMELPQHYRNGLNAHIYGNTHLCYTRTEVMIFFMFGRLFFLLRSMFEYVPYQDALATGICGPYHVKANIRFSIKCLFKMHPMRMMLFLIIVSLPFIAYLLRLVERPFEDLSYNDLGTYSTAMWCTAVTVATIGYGDYYPHTNLGRLICALAGTWGVVMFSVVVFIIQDGMDLTKRQNICFVKIRKVRAAGRAVLLALQYNHYRNHFGSDDPRTLDIHKQLTHASSHSHKALASINKYSIRREEEITDISSSVRDIRRQLGYLTRQLEHVLDKDLHRPINSSID